MDEKRYSTTDFYTTAMLLYKKFPILEVSSEGNRNQIKRFYFENTKELRVAIMEYTNGQMEGNIREFRNSIENVKDLIYT